MANEVSNISIRKYADSLRISDKAVRNAIRDGIIKKGVAYKTQLRNGSEIEVPEIIQKIADKEFGYKHKTDKVLPGQNKVKKSEEAEEKESAERVKKSKKQPQSDDDNEAESAELSEEDETLISSLKVTSNLKYAEAARRREIIALVMDKTKLQELEGALIRKDAVEKSLFAMGVELKKSLLNIPARVTAEVRGAANEVTAQTIMTVELTEILNQFANLQEIKL